MLNFWSESERKTILLSALLLFTVIAAFVVLKSGRDALFLGHFSSRLLPYFLAVSTVGTAIATAGYLRLSASSSLNRAVTIYLVSFAVGTLVLWKVSSGSSMLTTGALYVWVTIFGTLAPVQAWSVISRSLLKRQAKRALGTIGAGGILGGIGGGLFARWIVLQLGVPALLPAAAVLVLLSLLVVLLISSPQEFIEEQTTFGEPPKGFKRFARLVLIAVGTGALVMTFGDFQFKVIAQQRVQTAEQLALFFGSFYAYIGIATFVFQVLVTPFVIRRLPVSSALSMLPTALTVGNGLLLATGSLWSAVTIKGSEQLFKHSVDRSALELVYMAVPGPTKIRLKSVIDTMGVRISEGIGAGLLILLFSIGNFPVSWLALISLMFLAVWIGCIVLLGRQYPHLLSEVIKLREIDLPSARATLFTPDFYRVLPDLLRNSNRQTLLDLLDLMKSGTDKKLGPQLSELIDHEDADVRLKTLNILFDQDEDLSYKVDRLRADPDRRVRVEAVHYLAFRCGCQPIQDLQRLFSDPDPTVQAAACACSLNEEGTQEMAYNRMEELVSQSFNESKIDLRLEIAHVLEHVNPSKYTERLFKRLLSDPEAKIRKAALRSVARTRPSGLVPVLLHSLRDASLHDELRKALSAYGESLVPLLRLAVFEDGGTLQQKKQAIKIAADIGGSDAVDLILERARTADLVLRFGAIKALNRLRKRQSLDSYFFEIESILDQEIVILESELNRGQAFSPQAGSLMEAVFSQRFEWGRERIFRLLGLIYDAEDVYSAYVAFVGGNRRRADAALELLDTILSINHRERILPLLEYQNGRHVSQASLSERKEVLLNYLHERDYLPAAAAISDMSQKELNLWDVELRQAMSSMSNGSFVEENFNWRLAQMQTSTAKKPTQLTLIQKLENLRSADIFSRLGPHELLVLANQSQEVEFAEGERIFEEGDAAEDLFSVVSGTVEARSSSGLLNWILRPGDSFGALEVLGHQPRFLSTWALEDCILLKINGRSLWEILEDFPAVSQGIFEVLAHRIHELGGRATSLIPT